MSNYTKATNFATKDTLPTGNAGKIVKGTEIDDEFNAIASAISSKANAESPSLTGTPTAPTATSGTNTTQIANTAFVVAALQAVYPVGSVYINAASANNPSSLLGFGTWTAFGAGRVLVGLDSSDAMFDTVEETGGSKTSTSSGSISGTVGGTALTEAQMPKHYHAMLGPNSIDTVPNGTNTNVGMSYSGGTDDDSVFRYNTYSVGGNASSGSTVEGTSNGDSHTHSFSGSFSGSTQSTVQPYITVYMWKRTA